MSVSRISYSIIPSHMIKELMAYNIGWGQGTNDNWKLDFTCVAVVAKMCIYSCNYLT